MRVFRKKNAAAVVRQTPREKLKYVKKNWQLYVFFLLPGLLLTLIFKYGPMGGILIAFEDYNVIEGVLGSPWVGLDYFRRFLSSPDFMNYLMNTLKLSVFGLLWGFPIPIILALLLNQIRRTGIRKKIQLLIYAPNFISVIVLCGMVRMFLSPVGPINSLFGIDTNWMTMPEAFRTIYIASGIWQTAGWSSIMYTAALSNASKDLEEAAIVDGAGEWRIMFTIYFRLSGPVFATVGLWLAVGQWNDYYTTMLYCPTSTHLHSLQYYLMKVIKLASAPPDTSNVPPEVLQSIASQTVSYAAIVIAAIPILCAFPYIQRHLKTGAVDGSLKG